MGTYGTCVFCGSELIWQNDFYGEFNDKDEGAIVSQWTCPTCGAEAEFIVGLGLKTSRKKNKSC